MNRKQRRTEKSKGGSQATDAQGALNGLFKEALNHQEAGRLVEAERIYRQILTLDPRHAHSLHMMGLMAFDMKRYDIALELVRKALAEQGDFYMFHNSMGNILKAQDKPEAAVASYKRALALNPDFADSLNNLGATLSSLGRQDEALESCRRAVAVNPKHADAINNIGAILQDQGKHGEALEYYRQAIGLKPDSAEAHANLGKLYNHLGRPGDAKAGFMQALACKPDYAEAHVLLGTIFKEEGQFEEAMKHYLRATAIKPDGYAHTNIGVMLQDRGMLEEAGAHYKSALALMPDSLEIMNNIGTIYNDLGRYEEAIPYYERVLALQPDRIQALGNFANVLKNLGRLDEAIAYYKRALALAPGYHKIYSNLLFAMVYAASVPPEELAATARIFGERIADPLRRQSPARDADPERKLRIGYVSPDFHSHAVNYFFEPLLKRHDRGQFETFAYSNNPTEDFVTARLKRAFGHWRDISLMNDDEAADLIEADAIDILVDLAGHTAKNRLLLFARKPAPVQVSWLGYPATTGMKAMDYRMTDSYAEPAGMTEHLNVETLWRLPEIFCCYQAHENSPDAIAHPPSEDSGTITFGCFNNFAKVTDPVLATWARIIAQVPGSRLLLEIAGLEGVSFRAEIESRLLAAGLPLDRVMLEPRRKVNQFVLYNRIDIALDPFPCNGGTTSMDTVWMGVPFVTLAGKHFVSRMGVTILTNAGMPELIARDTDEYVKLAVDLALDKDRLRALRHNLRDRVARSPVMNQGAFARHMETAYREMWRRWCDES